MNVALCKSGFANVNVIRLHDLDWDGNGAVLLFLVGMGCSAYIFKQFAPRACAGLSRARRFRSSALLTRTPVNDLL